MIEFGILIQVKELEKEFGPLQTKVAPAAGVAHIFIGFATQTVDKVGVTGAGATGTVPTVTKTQAESIAVGVPLSVMAY
jgi:hypothetical protein